MKMVSFKKISLFLLTFLLLSKAALASFDNAFDETQKTENNSYVFTPLSKDETNNINNVKKEFGDKEIAPMEMSAASSYIKKINQNFTINPDGTVDFQERGTFFLSKKSSDNPFLFRRTFDRYSPFFNDHQKKENLKVVFVSNQASSPVRVNPHLKKDNIYFDFFDNTQSLNNNVLTGDYMISLKFIGLLDEDKDTKTFAFITNAEDFSLPVKYIFSKVFVKGNDVSLFSANSYISEGKHIINTDSKIIDAAAGYQLTHALYPYQSFNINLNYDKKVNFKTAEEIKARVKEVSAARLNKIKNDLKKPSYKTPADVFKHRLIISAFAIFLITLTYYTVIWFIYGKDNKLGTIVPRYEGIKNLSIAKAAAVYYGRNFNPIKTVTASLVSLAKRGFITIKYHQYENVCFKRTNLAVEETPFEEEQALLKELFVNQDSITFSPSSLEASAPFALNKYAEILNDFKSRMIKTNSFSIYIGVLITIIVSALLAFFLSPVFICILGLMAFYSIFFFGMLKGTKVKGNKGMAFPLLFLTFHASIFLSVFPYAISFEKVFKHNTFYGGYALIVLVMFLTLGLHFIFTHLMDKPSKVATDIITELEGIKMYIKEVETHRYNLMTPKIYESLLPYAMIFNLEEKWQGSLELYANKPPLWWDDSSDYNRHALTEISGIVNTINFKKSALAQKKIRGLS